MTDKIELELLGITYNQIESGVYAVILQQKGTRRRIPIVIGYPEAQAIECKLQEVSTPRPLTHDMMIDTLNAFGISLREIYIYRLSNGVFAADLTFTDGISTHIIDSRSSDAISLAIRVGAPIYTNQEVLDEAGFEPEEQKKRSSRSTHDSLTQQTETEVATNRLTNDNDLSDYDDEYLRNAMIEAAEAENYEEAKRIKEELDKRNNAK